jgi:hypothetical protein
MAALVGPGLLTVEAGVVHTRARIRGEVDDTVARDPPAGVSGSPEQILPYGRSFTVPAIVVAPGPGRDDAKLRIGLVVSGTQKVDANLIA